MLKYDFAKNNRTGKYIVYELSSTDAGRRISRIIDQADTKKEAAMKVKQLTEKLKSTLKGRRWRSKGRRRF